MDGSWIAEGFLGSGDLCVPAILSGEMRWAESFWSSYTKVDCMTEQDAAGHASPGLCCAGSWRPRSLLMEWRMGRPFD